MTPSTSFISHRKAMTMYQKIKEMADAAVKLQNKLFMESTLREISAACESAMTPEPEAVTLPVVDSMADKPKKGAKQ
jgi:hypothetical protein